MDKTTELTVSAGLSCTDWLQLAGADGLVSVVIYFNAHSYVWLLFTFKEQLSG